MGNYSRVMTKYFLAEGVVCKHALFVASADEDPQNIVSSNDLFKHKTNFVN